MNYNGILRLVEIYKENLNKIRKENYMQLKWISFSTFQNNWFAKHNNIYDKLNDSLADITNLMDSGANYLPKTNLLKAAQLFPFEIKVMIDQLFDEEILLETRLADFDKSIKRLNHNNAIHNSPNANLDLRARMVLLSLRYPEKYYLYKHDMYRDFASDINYPKKPIGGRPSSVSDYQVMCEMIKKILLEDEELVELHHENLIEGSYHDSNYTILTQDFIYSTVAYLPTYELKNIIQTDNLISEIKYDDNRYIISEPDFIANKRKGIFIDYESRNKIQSEIGLAGEIFVLKIEKDKIISNHGESKVKKLIHSAKIKGDGLGYDIKSIDEDNNKIFIEVKTTTGPLSSQFFITERELSVSILKKDKFRLYRVYDFNPLEMTGKILIMKGSLLPFCNFPSIYKCSIKEK